MNKTRPNRVYFRLSDEELDKLNDCIKASEMTRQDWLLSVVTPYLNGGDTTDNEASLLWRINKNTTDFLRNHISEFKICDDEDREFSEQVLDDIQIMAMALDGMSEKRGK